jgi:hypothetical protein
MPDLNKISTNSKVGTVVLLILFLSFGFYLFYLGEQYQLTVKTIQTIGTENELLIIHSPLPSPFIIPEQTPLSAAPSGIHDINFNAPFSCSVNPFTTILRIGQTVSIAITFSDNTAKGTVTLGDLPKNVSAIFVNSQSGSSQIMANQKTADLQVSAASRAEQGSFNVPVIFSIASLRASCQFNLTITP